MESKFKKGAAVIFTSEGLKTVTTYVWQVGASGYIVEHPQGMEFNEENKSQFEGFDTSKFSPGKKYLIATDAELQLKEQPTTEPAKNDAVSIETVKVDTEISVSFKKSVLQTVYESCFMQKASFGMQRGMIMLQTGLTEADMDKIEANLDEALKIFVANGVEELEIKS